MRLRRQTTSATVMLFTALALFGVDSAGLAPPAAAQTTPIPPTPPIPQVPLTALIIQAWIASYPTVNAQAAIVGKKYNLARSVSSPDVGWSLWTTVPAAMGEMNGTVRPLGYADFRAWLDVAVSVRLASPTP